MKTSKKTGVLYGLIISWIIAALLTVIVAFVFSKISMTRDKAHIFVLLIYVFANFFGGFICGKKTESRKFINGLICGVLFFVILIIASLIVNKGIVFSGMTVILTGVLCCASAMFGGMLS